MGNAPPATSTTATLAADYYRDYCSTHDLAFDLRTYLIMACHDLDDEVGIRTITANDLDTQRGVELYQVFKDADALDRFRLGPNGLDVRYLRTDEAKALYDYALSVWEQHLL